MDAYERTCKRIEEAAPGELLVANEMGFDIAQVMYAMRDEARKGCIEYVAPNIFRKPLHSQRLNVDVPVGPYEVVPIIARLNHWTVIPSENHCLNMLGLSTQVPAFYNYTSTGPDTIIQIGGHLVSFQHCGERYLTELSGRARLLVHAMSGCEQFDCSLYWERANRGLLEEDKQQLRQHMGCVPEWMLPQMELLVKEVD